MEETANSPNQEVVMEDEDEKNVISAEHHYAFAEVS